MRCVCVPRSFRRTKYGSAAHAGVGLAITVCAGIRVEAAHRTPGLVVGLLVVTHFMPGLTVAVLKGFPFLIPLPIHPSQHIPPLPGHFGLFFSCALSSTGERVGLVVGACERAHVQYWHCTGPPTSSMYVQDFGHCPVSEQYTYAPAALLETIGRCWV